MGKIAINQKITDAAYIPDEYRFSCMQIQKVIEINWQYLGQKEQSTDRFH